MAVTSPAQLKAVKKYRAANYETISFEVKRGCREEFKAKAAALGLTLAGFFKAAAEAYGADETPAEISSTQSAETDTNGAGGEVPIIYSERTQTAQNAPVSTNEQSIQPATENTVNRISTTDRRLLAAVDALSPESKQTLLKFLETLQG